MDVSARVFLLYKHIRVYYLLVILCNLSQIDSEAFFSTSGFFSQEFSRKSCVFHLFCISLL